MTSGKDADDLQSLKFVGPATAAVLEDTDVTAADIDERRVSHAELVAVGVNPGVAARIRREHSLAWSMAGGEDLDRRAEQVRGLQDDERAWVAASSGSWSEDSNPAGGSAPADDGQATDAESDWQANSWPSVSEAEDVETEEVAWREASAPTPVTDIAEIDEEEASLLAEAGITSVRSMATANPERVADSLGLDAELVGEWRELARAHER